MKITLLFLLHPWKVSEYNRQGIERNYELFVRRNFSEYFIFPAVLQEGNDGRKQLQSLPCIVFSEIAWKKDIRYMEIPKCAFCDCSCKEILIQCPIIRVPVRQFAVLAAVV